MRAVVVTDGRIWTAEAEYAALVARAEAEAGGEVVVAASVGAAILAETAGVAAPVALPGASPSRSPADFLAGVRCVSDLVTSLRPDVVHSSGSTAHLMAALAAGRRAPLVHLRGSARAPSGGPLNRYLHRRLTPAVIASSTRVRDLVISRLNMPPGRVIRILAPVDTERLRPVPPDGSLRGELGIHEASPIVVNVARLAPIKGHFVLIEAMPAVLSRVPGCVLVLVGEAWSGELEALRAVASRYGVERSVVFAGRRDDVPRFLASSAVCVSSSVGSEENSRAVSEYMAAGRPVVASRVGVIPELVAHGETGTLVPPGDPARLAEAIAGLLLHPAHAAALGARGREIAVERLSMGAFSRELRRALDVVGVRQ